MRTLLQDLKYGVRMLLKNPGFSFIAIITLALGIGANTAIFSVVNAVLLRPLPFAEPEQLVTVRNFNIKQGGETYPITWPDFVDYRAQNQSFESLAAFRERDFTLTGAGDAARLRGAIITSNLFTTLGVLPQLGRSFTAEEENPGTRTVVLSHSLWQSRFNSDPNITGRAVTINGQSFEVVGVMPSGFTFPIRSEAVDLWVNAGIDGDGESPLMKQRGNHAVELIGRLKSGVMLTQAQSEMARVAALIAGQYPDTKTNLGVRTVLVSERVIGDVRFGLLLLLGAVSCVLLIACTNVANLLLARASARGKEIAIRSALGANRVRVVFQLLTESILLALCGGLIGLLLMSWVTELLIRFMLKGMPRVTETSLDVQVLGFALLISLVTGVLFGLAPALQLSKTSLTESLKEGTHGTRGNRIRSSFIVTQIVATFILLVCAGLFINSFWRLNQVNLGFDPENVLTFRISLPDTRYEDKQVESFYQQLVSRIEGLPGVASVSAAEGLPLSGQNSELGFAVTKPSGQFTHSAFYRVVRPNYFNTMRITLMQGRDFDARDTLTSAEVVIINETLARKYFSKENPVGRHLYLSSDDGQVGREIIGVIKDVHHSGLSEESGAEIYAAHTQHPWGAITMVVRANSEPKSLVAAVRREVNALDKELPVYSVKTLEEYLSSSVAQPRFQTLLLVIFAGVALILTAIGLYGVIAYSVAQRTREIGVRIALGARTSDVMKMVLRQGMKLVAIGIVLGLIASFALTRLIKNLLFGVSTTDPLTFASIALLLTVVSLLACYIPARRAMKVDPMIALRYE